MDVDVLTISISFVLAYRGNCPPLSSNMAPLPSRLAFTDAKPHPSRPAASATPKTPFPLHLHSVRAFSPLVVLLAYPRRPAPAGIDATAAAHGRNLFPVRADRPQILVLEGAAALQIELSVMQSCNCQTFCRALVIGLGGPGIAVDSGRRRCLALGLGGRSGLEPRKYLF